jgi:hypothetical protein
VDNGQAPPKSGALPRIAPSYHETPTIRINFTLGKLD